MAACDKRRAGGAIVAQVRQPAARGAGARRSINAGALWADALFVIISPAIRAAFAARGGGPRAIFEARLAVMRDINRGGVMQTIEQGMDATRKARENTRAVASRELPAARSNRVDVKA
jgi:hypothetical protein